MNLKKIVAAVAAGAMALTMTAVSAFAATKEIDAEYPGAWTSTGKGITKEELQAVGGDVKITLHFETRNLANTADQFLLNPIDYDNGWKSQTIEFCTGDKVTAKTDGWICVRETDTELEFVYDAAGIDALGDSGLCFSVQNVTISSLDYELGEKQATPNFVDDAEGKAYCFSTADEEAAPAEEEAAPAEEEAPAEEAAVEDAPAADIAPASDAVTTSTETGNVPATAIVTVMAIAAAAAVATKRK